MRVMYCSGFSKRWVGVSFGVHVFIVRNLIIRKYVNSPFRFLFPTRFCVKNIGPGLSINIASDKIIQTGINTIIPMNDSIKSINRLKKCLYITAKHRPRNSISLLRLCLRDRAALYSKYCCLLLFQHRQRLRSVQWRYSLYDSNRRQSCCD